MEEHNPTWKSTVLYNVAWFIGCVLLILAFLNVFNMVQDILKWIAASIDVTTDRLNFEYTINAITQGMFFLGGASAVGLAIGIEYYFRLGDKQGKLISRIIKVFGILLTVIVVSVLVRVLVPVIF